MSSGLLNTSMGHAHGGDFTIRHGSWETLYEYFTWKVLRPGKVTRIPIIFKRTLWDIERPYVKLHNPQERVARSHESSWVYNEVFQVQQLNMPSTMYHLQIGTPRSQKESLGYGGKKNLVTTLTFPLCFWIKRRLHRLKSCLTLAMSPFEEVLDFMNN